MQYIPSSISQLCLVRCLCFWRFILLQVTFLIAQLLTIKHSTKYKLVLSINLSEEVEILFQLLLKARLPHLSEAIDIRVLQLTWTPLFIWTPFSFPHQ